MSASPSSASSLGRSVASSSSRADRDAWRSAWSSTSWIAPSMCLTRFSASASPSWATLRSPPGLPWAVKKRFCSSCTRVRSSSPWRPPAIWPTCRPIASCSAPRVSSPSPLLGSVNAASSWDTQSTPHKPMSSRLAPLPRGALDPRSSQTFSSAAAPTRGVTPSTRRTDSAFLRNRLRSEYEWPSSSKSTSISGPTFVSPWGWSARTVALAVPWRSKNAHRRAFTAVVLPVSLPPVIRVIPGSNAPRSTRPRSTPTSVRHTRVIRRPLTTPPPGGVRTAAAGLAGPPHWSPPAAPPPHRPPSLRRRDR